MTVIKDFMLTNNMISGLAAFLKDLLQTLVKMKICDELRTYIQTGLQWKVAFARKKTL